MDVVRIRELELDCIVGLRPKERTEPQRIRLDIALELDTKEAARTGRIDATADYARVAHEVIALLRFRRYQLIEMAAEELCAMLLGTYPLLHAVRLELIKPGALEGRAKAATVEIHRSRADYELSAVGESKVDYPMHIVHTRDAELWLIAIAPGEGVPLPAPSEKRAISWVILGQLTAGHRTLRTPGLAEDCEGKDGDTFSNQTKRDVLLFRASVLNGRDE